MVVGYFLQAAGPKRVRICSSKDRAKRPSISWLQSSAKTNPPLATYLWKLALSCAIELYQLMAADIAEGVMEDIVALQVEYFLLQVYRDRRIFYQGVQQVGWHPLVGIPISGPVS